MKATVKYRNLHYELVFSVSKSGARSDAGGGVIKILMNKYKQDFLESLLGESFFNAILHNEVKIYLMEQSDKGVSDLETSMDCFCT